MADTPDLSRTAAALKAYDDLHDTFCEALCVLSCTEAEDLMDKVDEAAKAVGVAYGLDTADRNSPETCAAVVRPGEFVRRMVDKWQKKI